MNFQEYSDYFENILNEHDGKRPSTYDNPDYLEYTKLNWFRMNRWFKKGILTEEVVEIISKIDKAQKWLIITEPWCGDASHNIPFIEMIASINDKIETQYILRDSESSIIDKYLTNGSKSIPKLIIRDSNDKDLGTWGPRPVECQKIFDKLMSENATFEKVKIEIQNWYNGNKGIDLQKEISVVLSAIQNLEQSF